MAALGEEFTLCGLLSSAGGTRQQDRLQGVEEARERDTVLVTDGGRTVTLYKVSDQKPLGSWAVRQGQRITCPAVYNHSSGEYVVVHDEKVIRVWRDDDISLDKVFKATLSSEVYRLHSLLDSEPLVLFRGGAVRHLDALLLEPQQEIETIVSEDEKIIWSQAFTDEKQPVLLFVSEKCPDLYVYTWCPSLSTSQKWRMPPATDGSTILDFSAMIKNRMVTLALLYSTGYVCLSEVSLAPCDQGEAELLVSPLLQVSDPTDTGALVILHDSYIATLAPCTAQQKDRLCIWNTSFQTLQDCKEFSQRTSAQLWNHDGKLYIPHANSLVVMQYTCERSCLASVLGKGKKTRVSAPEVVCIVNWESLSGKTEQTKSSASKRPVRGKKQQSSCVETGSSLELSSDIQTAPESQIPSLVQRVWIITELAPFQIAVSNVIRALVTRCRNEPKFYPQSSIVKLIKSGKLSYSLCPDLMPLCLEKQDVQALQLCLENFVDIPEDILCSCLKLFLSVSEDVLSKAPIITKSVASYIQESDITEEAMDTAPTLQNGFSSPIEEEDSCDVQLDKMIPKAEMQSCPVTLRRAVLLNSALISPFSETYLLPHLKDLASEQVVIFLNYLYFLYKKCSENLTLDLARDERLSVTQVLDWMNLILDANFTVLVLLPKAKPLLRTLQKFVRSQMKFLSELNKIEGSLSELQKFRRPSQNIGRYSIEVLELY